MRYYGNKICPDERTNGRTDGEPKNIMPSGGEDKDWRTTVGVTLSVSPTTAYVPSDTSDLRRACKQSNKATKQWQ